MKDRDLPINKLAMLRKVFSIGGLFLSIISFSQSGYMGKTVYLDYNAGVSFTPGLPTYNLSGDDFNPRSFYGLSHEFSVHKIVSRKHEISPYFNYSRTSFIDLSNKIHNSTYGINFRFFFKSIGSWNVAPVGNYFDLKPFVSSMKILVLEKDEKVPLYRLNAPGLALGFGRQRVIQNRILFNYGVQFTLPFSLFTNFGDISEAETSYLFNAVERSALKTLLEVKIGIGFLTF